MSFRKICCLGLMIFSIQCSGFSDEINWENISRENMNIRTAAFDAADPQAIYIGTDKGVLMTQDAGHAWRRVLSIAGRDKTANHIWIGPENKDAIWAATANGLFFSANGARDWKRIYRGKNYLENDCTGVLSAQKTIYLGTKQGLFVSKDYGRAWHKEKLSLGDDEIIRLCLCGKNENNILAASDSGLYKAKKDTDSWERVFVARVPEGHSDPEEEPHELEGAQDGSLRIKDVICREKDIYLATSRGIYRSPDEGLSWQPFPDYGLPSENADSLFLDSKGNIYAGVKSGIFEYSGGQWQELGRGPCTQKINFLAAGKQGNIYAGCDKGLFRINIAGLTSKKINGTLARRKGEELSIREVQEIAIRYAEVGPDKIEQWRRLANKKAWLPEFSVGVSRNSADVWHWESGSSTKYSDDTLRRGRDTIDWDVSLKWDLSEIIWNDDQISIDVRSRLNAQLREDILDEVTKLYFERLRLKMEMDGIRIEDRKKLNQMELKIEELTASLDALTGGRFSKGIRNEKES